MSVEVADVGVGPAGRLARPGLSGAKRAAPQRQVERRQRQQARPGGRVDHLPFPRSRPGRLPPAGPGTTPRPAAAGPSAPPPRGPPAAPGLELVARQSTSTLAGAFHRARHAVRRQPDAPQRDRIARSGGAFAADEERQTKQKDEG